MNEEIKQPLSGGEEVSVKAVSSAPKEPKAAEKIKKQLAEKSKEELKKYNRESKAKQRKKDTAVSSVVGRKYFSTTEITKKQALEILERERNIHHPRVLEVCWLLAQIAARNLKIPLNVHLFTHGVTQTLEAIKTKQEQEPPSID